MRRVHSAGRHRVCPLRLSPLGQLSFGGHLRTGKLVESEAEKLAALEALTEHIAPGRWANARQPNQRELNVTAVIALHIESASAKIRTGPPSDDEEDYALPIWAGVLPLELRGLRPIDDPKLTGGIDPPSYVTRYGR